MTHIKTRQTATTEEHTTHVRHIARIEMTHIKTRQTATVLEHTNHVRHIAGIQVLQALDLRQLRSIIEPTGR